MAHQTLFFINNYTIQINIGPGSYFYPEYTGESDLYATDGSTFEPVAQYNSTPAFEPQTGPNWDPLSDVQYPGPDVPLDAAVAGKLLYLTLPDLSQQVPAIWSYDGTYLTQISSGYNYGMLTSFGNDLVFTEDSAPNFVYTLAIYHPSTRAISQPSIPHGGYDPSSFGTLDGTLYFEAFDPAVGREAIYSYEGSAVTEQYNSATNPAAGPLFAYNGHIYYGSTSSSIDELTPSSSPLDATSTSVVTEDPGKPNDIATSLIVANDRLYFLAGSGGIYSLDASNRSTQVAGVGSVFNPVVYDDKLYFVAEDSNKVSNLYATADDTATKIASDFSGSDFVVSGNTLYFSSSAGLGTINGTSVNVATLPGGTEVYGAYDEGEYYAPAAGTPLVSAPFTPISWGPHFSTTYNGGGSPVPLDNELNLLGIATIPSATVSIGNFLPGDTLNFTNQNGITGSYDSSTGVLTLTGKANTGTYAAALDSVTYSFIAGGDPSGGGSHTSRAITWTIDGLGSLTSSLTTVHTPPSFSVSGSATFVGGDAPIVPQTALTVSDPDSNGKLTGATVSVASGFINGDTLNFKDQNGITGHYDSKTGVLTLTGLASIGDYRAALASITYGQSPADADPTGGGTHTTRTIGWVVTDGNTSNGISNSGKTVLTTVHIGPTLTAGVTAAFTGGDSPVPLNSSAVIDDPDSGGQLVGATIKMQGFIKGDSLSFTKQGGITGSYDANRGVLALTGKASIAAYQAVLRSVAFGFTPDGDPTGGGMHTSRLFTWTVNDGVDSSPVVSSALSVAHAPPTVTASGSVKYDGGSAVAIDPNIAIADPDSGGLLTHATIALSNGFLASDTLGFIAQHGITGTYDDSSGTLTLRGAASIADYQAALASVTFSSAAAGSTNNGNDLSRTISWSVDDGVDTSAMATSMVKLAPPVPGSSIGLLALGDLLSEIGPLVRTISENGGFVGQYSNVLHLMGS